MKYKENRMWELARQTPFILVSGSIQTLATQPCLAQLLLTKCESVLGTKGSIVLLSQNQKLNQFDGWISYRTQSRYASRDDGRELMMIMI